MEWAFLGMLLGLACGGRGGESGLPIGSMGSTSGTNRGGASQGETGTAGASGGRPAGVGGAEQAGAAPPVTLVPIDEVTARRIAENACDGYSVEAEPLRLHVQWILDGSSSMADMVNGTSSSKWALVANTVQQATSLIYDSKNCFGTSIGAIVFPGKDTDGFIQSEKRPVENCIDLAAQFVPDTEETVERFASFLASVKPIGGTPLLDAYRSALAVAKSQAGDITSVILVSDGMPTMDAGCTNLPRSASIDNYWPEGKGVENLRAPVEPILKEIELARAAGMRTYVLGLANSAATQSWLSRAAVLGDTPRVGCVESGSEHLCHYDLTTGPRSAMDLVNALLGEIGAGGQGQFGCRFDLPQDSAEGTMKIDPMQVTPIIRMSDGRIWLVPRDDGPAETCADGFRVVGEHAIELCPATCALMRNDCTAGLQLMIGCDGGFDREPLLN